MNEISPQTGSPRWPWWLAGGCVLIVLIGLLLPRPGANSSAFDLANVPRPGDKSNSSGHRPGRTSRHYAAGGPAQSAEEIVARKLTQFGKSRRDLVHAIAKHFKMDVPDEVERFFDAVERGRWEEIDAAHEALLLTRTNLNQPKSAELHQIWRSIQETWGAAKETHNWPAQKLLDYGEAVLGSLKPGMIYVGGTDPGCFIPTFLNETSDGERHITLTQNALADGTYLDYLNFLHGDRLNTLTHDDSQRAFQDYISEAQKRLRHDRQFPDESKQVKPGEDIRIDDDGKIQVSGQVAVMAINEKLLQTLMDKNPDASFAIEQSFPFESMYSNTVPLGPIMELRVADAQNVFTAELASQSVDYWRTTAQQLLEDTQTSDGSDPRKAYSKLISEQAALLLNHKFTAEAEQAFQIATTLCPSSPEAVFRYANLLVGQKRFDEAIGVANSALKADPNNTQFRDLAARLAEAKSH